MGVKFKGLALGNWDVGVIQHRVLGVSTGLAPFSFSGCILTVRKQLDLSHESSLYGNQFVNIPEFLSRDAQGSRVFIGFRVLSPGVAVVVCSMRVVLVMCCFGSCFHVIQIAPSHTQI